MLTLSHRKDWDQYNFIKPEQFQFKNRHGDIICGMIFKPYGWKPGDKRPGIIYLYGGPLQDRHTVEVDNFSILSYMFQMIMAAKHGYVTINIDPRGQTGYGRAFSEANWQQPGKPQVEDLEDLVAHIKTGFGVDTSRLGLHGWSFGGFQTLMTMFTSPDTFACGIAVASVTEWENYNAWYAGSTIGKSVRGKPTLRKYSLIPLAKNLKKPLLLVHGMMDPNVLFQDTLNVYKALLEAGKETLVDLFLDPEGKHGLGGNVQNKAVYKKFATFFLRHLGTYD
ncbi:MAG: S9 family peptidase [Candidatus Aminicenantes bacterium]|nr:MAG: S9 family peptidase [Candidatus Aminicenantes bacterium]